MDYHEQSTRIFRKVEPLLSQLVEDARHGRRGQGQDQDQPKNTMPKSGSLSAGLLAKKHRATGEQKEKSSANNENVKWRKGGVDPLSSVDLHDGLAGSSIQSEPSFASSIRHAGNCTDREQKKQPRRKPAMKEPGGVPHFSMNRMNSTIMNLLVRTKKATRIFQSTSLFRPVAYGELFSERIVTSSGVR